MNIKLIKNISFYSIGNILQQATTFMLLPIYTKYLTPMDYGIFNSMNVLQSIIVVFMTFGTEKSIYRLIYDYKSKDERMKFIGSVVLIISIIASIITSIFFLIPNHLSKIFSNISFYPYYSYTILSSFLLVYSNIPKILLQVEEKSQQFLVLSLIQLVLYNCLVWYFVIINKEMGLGMLKAAFYSALVLLPYYIYYLTGKIKIVIDFSILRNIFSFSIPMIPNIVFSWIINLSDRIFIEKYLNLSEVGIYSLGFKIGSIILIFASSFYTAFNPYFYKIANSENQLKAKEKLYNTITIYLIVLILICFVVAFFSKEIIYLLFDERYKKAYTIVPIIALSYLISQSNGILNLYFYQQKKSGLISIFVFVSAFISIVFNILLIPRIGIEGAAYASLISSTILFTLQYCLSKYYYFIQFNWKILIPLIIILICTWILFSISDYNISIIFISKIGLLLFVLFLIVNKKKYLLNAIIIKS